MKYTVVNLLNLLKEIGETETKSVLSVFSCPLAPNYAGFRWEIYLC